MRAARGRGTGDQAPGGTGRLGTLLCLFVLATGCTTVNRAVSPAPPAAGASLAVEQPAGGGASLLRPPKAVDHVALGQALSAAGMELVEGTNIYGSRIQRDSQGLQYREFDAGGGALTTDFWPASSIKVVAAVGALEFLSGMGFTGAASVTTEEGSVTVRDLYAEAVRDSSNLAYDWLVEIAGVDWLNTEFLVPRNGYVATVIQRSYTGWGLISSPPMTISEGDRTVELPARDVDHAYPCPNDGNCSNLLELSDSVRRVVLAEEIPSWERFVLAPEDVSELRQALLDADGFVEAGAAPVLGSGTRVFNKPGEAPDDDCVDVAVVQGGDQAPNGPGEAEGYVVAIATPEDGRDCASVSELAEVTLSFLEHDQP